MGLRTQKQVIANLDRTAGGHMRRAKRGYREAVLEPLLEELRAAGSGAEALKRLNAGLLRTMQARRREGTEARSLEAAVSDAYVQSGLIGRASAQPGNKATRQRGSKSAR